MKSSFEITCFMDYLCCFECERATSDLPWVPYCNVVCCTMFNLAYEMYADHACFM